jgi:ADP-heptose:LPS heptosyltransferase
MIRNIARRLKQRVDVVVAGDYSDLLFCVSNREYVNHAYLLNDDLLQRRYDTVFLSHSFGSLVPQFAARRVLESRKWETFGADHRLHEAEFNLAAAESLLGVPYDDDDVRGYYFGDFRYVPPQKFLVGLHGGSKGGIWSTKRWPHFAELAEYLKRRGVDVASFGTHDEYVPGTLDMTGGSIQEMATRMLRCSHFVSNDSGVMNTANALGIPLVALFGPTNAETRGPLSAASVALAVHKDCAPCEMHPVYRGEMFVSGECRCIGEISVDDVVARLNDMFQ